MTHRARAMAACTLLALSQAVVAADASWGGSLTLASDHLLRGVSRSSNDPSLSAEVHARGATGWFAGLWAGSSRVRPADDTVVDLAASLGAEGRLGSAWAWRGSFSHYESPWQYRAALYRYNEFTLDLQWRDLLLLSASWSPDTRAYGAYPAITPRSDALAYEISAQPSLTSRLHVQAAAGYHDVSRQIGRGYWYGSLGLGYAWTGWQANVSWAHAGASARRMSWPEVRRGRALLRLGYRIPDT